MKNCSNCGEEVADDALLCPYCAFPLTLPQAPPPAKPKVSEPAEKPAINEQVQPPVIDTPPQPPVISELVQTPVINEQPQPPISSGYVQQPSVNTYINQTNVNTQPQPPQQQPGAFVQPANPNSFVSRQNVNAQVQQTAANSYVNTQPINIVSELSQRMRTSGIIWIVLAAINFFIGFALWFTFISAVVYGILGYRDLQYSKDVVKNPNGIVEKFRSTTGPVLILIYAILFGGFLGIIGCVYYLTSVRSFVMSNEAAFRRISPVQYSPQS